MKYTAALLAFAVGALAHNCRASCLGIARPNSSQAVETTECAAKCDQGDGTAEATKKYSDCVQSCIASLFPSSQTGSQIPGAAASSGAAAGTGTKSANPTASTGASGSGSGSNVSQTGSAASQATGAANSISARIGGAGLAGLLAVFAL
ncbi:hypothetical protein N0V95_003037 [Ascochyta clinopodiicola]|nr:hypothetical protein N0V95_003037 [Ascochyta clinopodiicola]